MDRVLHLVYQNGRRVESINNEVESSTFVRGRVDLTFERFSSLVPNTFGGLRRGHVSRSCVLNLLFKGWDCSLCL